ncbi:MAG: VCBS repeat-containing protein, partial [Phycisphaerales bacterium]|nr:VCBS repeat-containing protein [Phycisphaerales bacterium]
MRDLLNVRFVLVLIFCTSFGVASLHAKFAPPLLSEQATNVGFVDIHQTFLSGPDMEFMAGGGAAGDFDNDGDQDIFVLGGSASVDRLYINDGNGFFTETGAAAGIDRTHQGSGVAVGDYDSDGDLDVFVSSLGPTNNRQPGSNILWSNDGDGTFTDVTSIAGVAYASPSVGETFSASFGDYDLDGDLDLAVAGWLGGSQLFKNNGDGTFTNVTTTALDANMTVMRAFAPRFVDMDGDLYPEILWVGDFYTSKYFVNNTDGTFTEQTATSGTGLDSNGMGNTFGDYNQDGEFDWYVSSRISHDSSNGSGNMLYVATGVDHVYNESSIAAGCNFGYWGWGVVSIDINHDGSLDIFETNGFDGSFLNDPSLLFLNDGTGNFTDVSVASGLVDAGQGRGVINADFDRDGDQDIIVLNNRQQMVYYRNDLTGSDINSITLDF